MDKCHVAADDPMPRNLLRTTVASVVVRSSEVIVRTEDGEVVKVPRGSDLISQRTPPGMGCSVASTVTTIFFDVILRVLGWCWQSAEMMRWSAGMVLVDDLTQLPDLDEPNMLNSLCCRYI